MRTFLLWLTVLMTIGAQAQPGPIMEATPAQVTAGTLGLPYVITPRRLIGETNSTSATVISNLVSLERSYKPVFFSQSRGNDSTGQPYRYDLPYLNVANAVQAATNAGDLVYGLDGGYYGGASAPTIPTGADVFLSDGVLITNITWSPTNAAATGGVWHMYGRGGLYSDNSSIFNSVFLIDNSGSGVNSSNTTITVYVEAKNIITPTNTPAILFGRGISYTNIVNVVCSDSYNGPIEHDGPSDGSIEKCFANVNATDIITGSGQPSVGSTGNLQDQTNRVYTLNAKNTLTLATAVNGLNASFCTFIINGSPQITDLRFGTSINKHLIRFDSTVHFYDLTKMTLGKYYSGFYAIDFPTNGAGMTTWGNGIGLGTNGTIPSSSVLGGVFSVTSPNMELLWVTPAQTYKVAMTNQDLQTVTNLFVQNLLTVTNGFISYETNTLTVTSGGITNNTGTNFVVAITAGTAMSMKDSSGNQFLVPVLGASYPLKPGWRLTGTSITGTCIQYP